MCFNRAPSAEELYTMLGYNASVPPSVRQALFARVFDNADLPFDRRWKFPSWTRVSYRMRSGDIGTGLSNARSTRAPGIVRHLREYAWLFALAAGAVTGFLFLGVGGRIAMRLFALHTGVRPSISLGGTTTVILMGIASGIAGAVIRAAAATWLPKRLPVWIGSTIFASACLLLTLRGLKPVDAARLTYFLPWAAAYIIAFELMWWRWTVLRHRVATRGDAA